jgi:hypothetical protein
MRKRQPGALRLITAPPELSQRLALSDARIRDCERRIRKLEGILARLPDNARLRFIGAGLLTEFKVALREYRANRKLLLRSVPHR